MLMTVRGNHFSHLARALTNTLSGSEEFGDPKTERMLLGTPPKILNAEEQEKMRNICKVCQPLPYLGSMDKLMLGPQLSREVLDLAAAALRPGITTDEIDEIVHNATVERNAYPSPLNYRRFPKSVCTYESSTHPNPQRL